MKIGDEYEDGIIFHINSDGISGLIAMKQDLQGDYNWKEALIACNELGNGYRLPTKEELNLLYKQKDIIGGFANFYYWSSTEYGSNHAWCQYFDNGLQGYGYKNDALRVRAVRAFSISPIGITGKEILINPIFIANDSVFVVDCYDVCINEYKISEVTIKIESDNTIRYYYEYRDFERRGETYTVSALGDRHFISKIEAQKYLDKWREEQDIKKAKQKEIMYKEAKEIIAQYEGTKED